MDQIPKKESIAESCREKKIMQSGSCPAVSLLSFAMLRATKEMIGKASEVKGVFFKFVFLKWKTPFERDLLVKVVQLECQELSLTQHLLDGTIMLLLCKALETP